MDQETRDLLITRMNEEGLTNAHIGRIVYLTPQRVNQILKKRRGERKRTRKVAKKAAKKTAAKA